VEAKLGGVGGFDGADAGAAFAEGLDGFGRSPAERADGAQARNRDAPHHYSWAAEACLAATSFSTPSHIWRTFRTVRTSSSGILMSNSFSSAKRISTASMESIPSSWNWLSMVTVSGGMRLEVAIVFRTRCVMSSDIRTFQ